MNDWIDYQPRRNRDKEFYDIMLRDGTILHCCYPNGVGWYPATGKRIADYRVIKIRRCPHPISDIQDTNQNP
jgi:hypothetical protein